MFVYANLIDSINGRYNAETNERGAGLRQKHECHGVQHGQKRVARYPDEEVIPESQITEDMEETAKEQVNALRVILDNKHANAAVLIRPGVQLDSNPFSYAAREIIQVEAVVQSYNVAVAPYTSSNNHMFKQSHLSKLHELLNPIGLIRGGLLKLVASIMKYVSHRQPVKANT